MTRQGDTLPLDRGAQDEVGRGEPRPPGSPRAPQGRIASTRPILASAGVSAALTSDPLLGRIVTVGGCLYLIWLGGRLIVPGSIEDDESTVTEETAANSLLPWAVFGFQFINPKAWVLVLTTNSALLANFDAASALVLLIGLFLVISTPALLLWSLLGSRFASRLRRPRTRALFDRGMGALLVAFALLLLFESR